MRNLKVSFLALILTSLASSAIAKAVSTGGGKYGRCQTSYDKCMDAVFGSPGSQGYNVGKSNCYKAWKGCVGMGALALDTGSPASDIAAIQAFENSFLLESSSVEKSNVGESETSNNSPSEESNDSVWE
ncbi:MAG: hypothetical protein H7318_19245 [Oligoflexus sp.]|nr:hypothetical protein [Oligoflexus sp.]